MSAVAKAMAVAALKDAKLPELCSGSFLFFSRPFAPLVVFLLLNSINYERRERTLT
jgi:hypothetical protein